jgi:hypothetical protein
VDYDHWTRLSMELDALYFLNMDELACSDLDADDRLVVDYSEYPYREPHASSEIERTERKQARRSYERYRREAKLRGTNTSKSRGNWGD